MTGFKNRLRANSNPIGDSGKISSRKPLTGKDLAEYVTDNKSAFKKNGDALCVEAGYGEYATDGTPQCDFQPFVQELGKVMDLEADARKKENPE